MFYLFAHNTFKITKLGLGGSVLARYGCRVVLNEDISIKLMFVICKSRTYKTAAPSKVLKYSQI